jgi:hypothetical protein
MALLRDRVEQLRQMRAGAIGPGSSEGQNILQAAFREDHALALRLVEGLPKDNLVRGLKLAGFNTAEIGHLLFRDAFARAAFHEQEKARALRIGTPGHDDFGYPAGLNEGDPFGPRDLRVSVSDMVRPDEPGTEPESELAIDPLRHLMRGPRPR